MPHIHDLIDFTVGVFIVHNHQVLMIHHKKLNRWLCVGGHIELDEDPEQAAIREAKEESGLDIELIGTRPPVNDGINRGLITPWYLDIHSITEQHRHIGMMYVARSTSADVVLATEEHHAIRWFSSEELDDPNFNLTEGMKFYAREALRIAVA